jgi:hypothetical protein
MITLEDNIYYVSFVVLSLDKQISVLEYDTLLNVIEKI